MDPLEEISNFWGIREYLFPVDLPESARAYLEDFQRLDFFSPRGSRRSTGAGVPWEPV